MLYIAIVDDEREDREKLKGYVEHYFAQQGGEIQLTLYEDGAALAERGEEKLDILFLDIQMAQLDGVSTARLVRQYHEDTVIIFITNMVQYAIEGYSVNALDFVLKPIDEAVVKRALDKALKQLQRSAAPVISVHSGGNLFVVDTGEIRYIETYERKIRIHTEKEAMACGETLQAIEKKLPEWFFRCHSAYLVNLRKVERIVGSDIIVGGERIPLSKHRKKEFMQAMTRYVKELL